MELEIGRPNDTSKRLEKEIRVYDLLDLLNINYERIDHASDISKEDFEKVRVLLEPAPILKNLFLCNRQETKFYMLTMIADKKFETKVVSKQIQSARISFAKESYMLDFLDITPGSVSIMGLMNDKNNNVQLLVDEDVLKCDYMRCHPCINTTSMKLKTKDVFGKFLDSIKHTYITVKI